MGAGTHDTELARTRALLHVSAAYLKRAKDPDQRKVALSRVDQLLDRLHQLMKNGDT